MQIKAKSSREIQQNLKHCGELQSKPQRVVNHLECLIGSMEVGLAKQVIKNLTRGDRFSRLSKTDLPNFQVDSHIFFKY